ncbi:MAG: hypothetical protein LBH37_03380 [Oscillospiraceae bacterium]|jgi:hypothetical protein|nr:hypothetical protein [Oscillospiraceae bacterium]
MVVKFRRVLNLAIIIALVFLILFGFHFFYKSAGKGFDNGPEGVFKFSKKAQIKTEKTQFDCEILRTLEGITDITVFSPETIKGLKFSWLGDHQEISLGGALVSKSSQDILPINSPPCAICKVLNHASKLGSKSKNIKSTVDTFDYLIELDENSGEINNIKIPSLALTANFTD